MLALGIVGILQVSEVVARTAGAVLALFLGGTYCRAGDFLSEFSETHSDVLQGWQSF